MALLPRRLARRYFRWRRGDAYDHVRLLSFFELRRLGRANRFRVTIWPGAPSAAEAARLSGVAQAVLRLHRIVKDWPVIRQALLAVGPWLFLAAVRDVER